MAGITRKMHIVGTVVRTGELILQYADACDACGCLVIDRKRRRVCSGRCGFDFGPAGDAIPTSEVFED